MVLQRELGLGPVPYLNDHVSADRPSTSNLPSDLRGRIEESNELDRELHEFAHALLDEKVDSFAGTFATHVNELRSVSADENEQAIFRARQWLDQKLARGPQPADEVYAAAIAEGVPRAALKHVLERSAVEKIKGKAGEKLLRLDPSRAP